MQDNYSLGHWLAIDLEKTAKLDSGAGDDSGLPHLVRFKREVHRTISKRQSNYNSQSDPKDLYIFLQHSGRPTGNITCKREPMLDAGHICLSGKIWFVSPAVSSGYYAQIPHETDGDAFDWIIDELNMGDIPAIIVNPCASPTQLRLYHKGLSNDEHFTPWDLSPQDVSPEEVRRVVNQIHNQCLITPDAQSEETKLWNKNSAPVSKAEKRVQAILKPGLAGAFLDCIIREEQASPSGRYDLSIVERNAPQKNHALLELKILRSTSDSGKTPYSKAETDKAIQKGIDQAYSYRLQYSASWSSLCCFDMRKIDSEEDCFNSFQGHADKTSVLLWRWFLYRSSEEWRKVIAQLA